MKRELAFFKYLHPRLKNTECIVFLNAVQIQQHRRYLLKGEQPPLTIVAATEAAEQSAAQAKIARSQAAAARRQRRMPLFVVGMALGAALALYVLWPSAALTRMDFPVDSVLALQQVQQAERNGVILLDGLADQVVAEVISQRHQALDLAAAAIEQGHFDAAATILDDWPSTVQGIDEELQEREAGLRALIGGTALVAYCAE